MMRSYPKHTITVSDGTTSISGSVTAVADKATTFAVAFPASASEKDYTLSIPGCNNVVKGGKTLAAGKVVNITTDVTETVPPLPGVFSVADGKTVKFSKGNLQYTKSTGILSFMANQYSTVETTGQNVGDNYANQDVVSLFGWGTSGWNNHNMFYQPYNTRHKHQLYNESFGYGPKAGKNYNYSLTGTYANADWGHNAISNGGATADSWRTLTMSEWVWLLGPNNSPNPGTNCRISSTVNGTENARFAIILPSTKEVIQPHFAVSLKQLLATPIPPKKQYLERVRDVFVFCCFTGLRHSDAYNLTKSDVKDDCIEITTKKTADSLTIELNDVSRSILQKYKDEVLPNNKALPVISNQKMNEYLKELCQLAGFDEEIRETSFQGNKRIDVILPKYELIRTHAGRRSFICNALAAGIPVNVVMKWTGHSDYKVMRPYIDVADKIKAQEMKKLNNLL